jgi:hypothetical protein
MTEEPEESTMDFNELELEFDFDVADFSFEAEAAVDTRIIKPPRQKDKVGLWKNAVATATKIDLSPGFSYFGVIDGSFIFGDLIEALLVGKMLRAERLDIQTLSMSQDNVDSLQTLLIKGYIGELNLIVSDYFFSNERQMLIPYIYDNLDLDNRFQLAVAGTHMKTVTANLSNGTHLVIDGSANLRSSANIEQIRIEDNEIIYTFVTDINDRIIEAYKTINKSIRRQKLWRVIGK